MQVLGRNYVAHVNVRYRRTGTLWEGRYKSCLVDSENYVLACYRYIELNPVRAGMVGTAAEYRWSSHHCNALGEPDRLVRPHSQYLALGQGRTKPCSTKTWAMSDLWRYAATFNSRRFSAARGFRPRSGRYWDVRSRFGLPTDRDVHCSHHRKTVSDPVSRFTRHRKTVAVKRGAVIDDRKTVALNRGTVIGNRKTVMHDRKPVAHNRAAVTHDRRTVASPCPVLIVPAARRYHPAMAKLLLNLRNVPDDEADDVRAMLDAARIAFHETPPSMWGISAGGIYVTENADVAEAKRLMADYQAQRRARARAEREAAVRDGTAETFRTMLRAEPLRVVLTVLAIIFLLGLMALPMVLLRGG